MLESTKLETEGLRNKYLKLVILEGLVYIVLQAALFFLPIDPYTDYYNHINWGIGYADGLEPYSEYHGNEYPILSAWGWIIAYQLSPEKTYIWLSIIMNLPYWILAWAGGTALFLIISEQELSYKQSFYITSFFYFLPLNFIDTLNNHGSLGTSSTVILAIYFLKKNRYFLSAGFIATGFSIKLYPIFIVPFMVHYCRSRKLQVKYVFYLIGWILFYHIPIFSMPQDYFDVLFWRTTRRDGITYSFLIEFMLDPLGMEHLVTLIWLGVLGISALILLFEDKLTLLDKYAIIIMMNNLFEPRGGIGHIATALPFMAIYFFCHSKNVIEKRLFIFYVAIGSAWGSGRFFLDPNDFPLILGAILILSMILSTTIIFIMYLRGLRKNEKLSFQIIRRMKS